MSRFRRRSSENDQIIYPLRNLGSGIKFCGYLFVLPIFLTGIILTITGQILFPWGEGLPLLLLKYSGIIMGLLILLWGPNLLAMVELPELLELSLLAIRNISILIIIYLTLPFKLLTKLLEHTAVSENIIRLVLGIIFLLILVVSMVHHILTAAHEVRAGKEPRHRRLSERWTWVDAMMMFGILLGLTVVLARFFPELGKLSYTEPLDTLFILEQPTSAIKEMNKMRMLAWLCASFLSALVLFIGGALPNRVMKGTLISVTFHEQDVQGVIKNSYQYFFHFLAASLLAHPVIIAGGAFLTVVILAAPSFLIFSHKLGYLRELAHADEIILGMIIFFSWFAPLILAAIRIDETFGTYFNRRIGNLLMTIQRHIVLIGHGSLGKRVLDRQIRLLLQTSKWKNFLPYHGEKSNSRKKANNKKSFFIIVTPDIQLELVCTEFVVIEKDPTDVIYSTQNELLGMYGVVAAAPEMYTSKDLHNNIIHPEVRVLVPVVVGEAREPFINSRVNLERARLMISTVPDGETVQAVFERAVQSRIRSIVCIGHSDQISYLTYRARHHPVVLVYPRHNQGNTLGHRMWATMLKVRAIKKMKHQEWPNVLIIGNNKANRFMIETIWAYLPGTHEDRTDIVQKHFAFIVTPGEESIGYPILEEDQPKKGAFDLYWPESFITSGRFPYSVEQRDQLYPLRLKTRMVNDVDTRALIECISEHKPHIILINHDRMESGARMLLRCMRAIERLRIRIKNFHMPIILLSSAQADEKEHLVLGDASRYYDAICRLYNESLVTDNRYPGHARYDHYIREVIGETITDSLSDAEEMIIGAIKAFQEPDSRGLFKRFTRPGKRTSPIILYRLSQKGTERLREKIEQLAEKTFPFLKSRSEHLVNRLRFQVFKDKYQLKQNISRLIRAYVLYSHSQGTISSEEEQKISQATKQISRAFQKHCKRHRISPKETRFIEVSSCLPNRPGTLANYLACLAGLNYSPITWEKFETIWGRKKPNFNAQRTQVEEPTVDTDDPEFVTAMDPVLPSFQYLRHIKLDAPENKAFALTGYASLVPVSENDLAFHPESGRESLAVRIFVNDGRNYLERDIDPMEKKESPGVENLKYRWEMIEEPWPPGVPQVIDKVTRRKPGTRNTIEEYKKVLFGNANCKVEPNEYTCPGMNNCRIAAFQDYVSASNNLRLQPGSENEELWHARNYYCCTNIPPAEKKDLPTEKSHFARIFCCAYAEYQPGLIARVLNAFLFRSDAFMKLTDSLEKDWQINIDYLKHITCQNSYFSVNRLFGTLLPLTKQKANDNDKIPPFPMHLLRILPVGGIESARHWYAYGWVLWKFLREKVSPDFRFSWINGNRESLKADKDKFRHPLFVEDNPKEYPIAIMIKKPNVKKGEKGRSEMCRLCGLVEERYDCRRFRAWL